MAVKVDMREAEQFARQLERFGGGIARKVSARSLTKTAAVAKNIARKTVRSRFENRNKWTVGSVQSTRAAPRAIDDQFALAGSRQEYMRDQEFGASLDRGSSGRRITTARATGEGDTAFPRKKLARGKLRPGRMTIKSVAVRGRFRGKGRRAYAQVQVARRKRIKLVYLDWGGGKKGFHKVTRSKVFMVHALVSRRLFVRPRPWLGPSTDRARRLAPAIWAREVVTAVDEHGLFR